MLRHTALLLHHPFCFCFRFLMLRVVSTCFNMSFYSSEKSYTCENKSKRVSTCCVIILGEGTLVSTKVY